MIRTMLVSLREPSVFKLVCEARCHFVGPLPSTPTNDRVVRLLGPLRPAAAFLMPICAGDKVVNVLYGDCGVQARAPDGVSDLLLLAMKIPATFERLVAARRKADARSVARVG